MHLQQPTSPIDYRTMGNLAMVIAVNVDILRREFGYFSPTTLIILRPRSHVVLLDATLIPSPALRPDFGHEA
jgi:hypothetical protein